LLIGIEHVLIEKHLEPPGVTKVVNVRFSSLVLEDGHAENSPNGVFPFCTLTISLVQRPDDRARRNSAVL